MVLNSTPSYDSTITNLLTWKPNGLLHIHSVPKTLDQWAYTPTRDRTVRSKDRDRVWDIWLALKPFFSSKGYHLFQPTDERRSLVPSRSPNPQTAQKPISDYPFPRIFYENDVDIRFMVSSLRVWAARDHKWNDVVIRLISGAEPSEELRVWRRLHSPALKNHPRNRSIPVLDYIKFDELTFIVMPRWGCPVFYDFATAEEVFYFADCILDFVDFLHENRICHGDLTPQNTAINAISSVDMIQMYPKGRCNPKDALYAVFDFGIATAYPMASSLDEIRSTAGYGTELGQFGERNPFKVEMYWVAEFLQRYVRVTEEFIPEVIPYFESIMNSDEDHRPFAREALERFRQLQESLSVEQLKTPLKYKFWRKGRLIPKDRST